MENLNDSLSNANNNNVVDSLDALKDSQSKALETVEQINNLIEKQNPTDDSAASESKAELNLTDLVENQQQADTKVNELVSELANESNETYDKVNELVSELTVQTEEQVNDKVNELVTELTADQTAEEKPVDDLITNTSELSESTKQLFDDLNDTSNTNTLDSSKVLNSSNLENLTAENFLEHSIPSNHQAVIGDLLDCSVKETDGKEHLLDFTQESSVEESSKENLSDSAAIQNDKVNLLDELGLNKDNSRVDGEQIQCINLTDDSKEISLIDISSDDILDVQTIQATSQEEPSLQSDLLDQPREPANSELLTALVSDADSTSAAKPDGFFNELNKELHATADELNNMMSSITIQNEKEQPVADQLEDHVTKVDETEQVQKPAEETTAADQLAKSETFVVEKAEVKNEIESVSDKEQQPASEPPKEEPKEETKEESKVEIKEESSQAAGEQPKEEVASDSDPISPLPTCSKRDSKASEVLTESQEILKNADRLIEAKRNSINQDIRIPGLEISQSAEQSPAKRESSTEAQQTAITEPATTEPATSEPATSESQPATNNAEANETSSSSSPQKSAKQSTEKSSKKCVIS